MSFQPEEQKFLTAAPRPPPPTGSQRHLGTSTRPGAAVVEKVPDPELVTFLSFCLSDRPVVPRMGRCCHWIIMTAALWREGTGGKCGALRKTGVSHGDEVSVSFCTSSWFGPFSRLLEGRFVPSGCLTEFSLSVH